MTDIMEQPGRMTDMLVEAGGGAEAGPPAAVVALDSIYRERRQEAGFDKTPWSAYFYYVGKATAGSAERPVTAYHYQSLHGPIDRAALKQLTTLLARNARTDLTKQNPQPFTAAFNWNRKSYIIVLVDDPTYCFDKGKAIRLIPTDGGINHSFFDGLDLDDIDLPGPAGGAATERVTAVCFINHMKRSLAGDDLLAGSQHFQRQLSPAFTFKFAKVGKPSGGLTKLIAAAKVLVMGDPPQYEDDGGTNMGPPVPPP
jgi:hypothetical protein